MRAVPSRSDERGRTDAVLAVVVAVVAVVGAVAAPVAAAGPAMAGATVGSPGSDAGIPPLDSGEEIPPVEDERTSPDSGRIVAGGSAPTEANGSAPAEANGSATAEANGSAPAVESRTNVTLVTGQTVTVIETESGTAYRVDADGPVYRLTAGGDTYVFPADVDLGTFDRALFNVDLLVRQNLTDAETEAVPVIVEREDDDAVRRAGATAGGEAGVMDATGVTRETTLRSIGAEAGTVSKARAASAAAALRADDRVERVYLDRKLSVALDDADDAVNASGARAAYDVDGTGVTVAVIDTGIDDGHPDIGEDRVVAEKDFTGEGGTGDPNGHGTHVAGIVAGDGTAGGGQYVGMAPNASLIDARVLGESGAGFTSDIVEGMNWSVDQGADVLSMSLSGSADELRDDDPYADAVDYAVDQGVPVVVSAGNDGPDRATVGSPGVIEGAITVGATDGSADAVASYSSRGPTPVGLYLKPDLVAPGTGITSAEAGTDGYTSKTGTSMSAPMVSGVTALLLEHDPDRSPERVRAALMTTADPLSDGSDAYASGAGQLNATAAVDPAVVISPGTTDFGNRSANTTVNRTVTVVNRRDTSRTLTLSATAENALDGANGSVALNRSEVTLPASGSEDVRLTVNTSIGSSGIYAGRLTASDSNGTYRSVFGYALTRTVTVEKRAAGDGSVDGDPVVVANESDTLLPASTVTTLDDGTVEVPVVGPGDYYAVSIGANESDTPVVTTADFSVESGNETVVLDEGDTVAVGVDAGAVPAAHRPLSTHGVTVDVKKTAADGATATVSATAAPSAEAVRFSAAADLTARVDHLLVADTNDSAAFDAPAVYDTVADLDGIDAETTIDIDPDAMSRENVTYYRSTPEESYNVTFVTAPRRYDSGLGFLTVRSGGIGDRVSQTVYVAPGATIHRIEAEGSYDGGTTWSLSGSEPAPAQGESFGVPVADHPMIANATVTVDATDDEIDVYGYSMADGSGRFLKTGEDDTLRLLDETRTLKSVDFGDGSGLVELDGPTTGETYEVQVISRSAAFPQSTRSVLNLTTTYDGEDAVVDAPRLSNVRTLAVGGGPDYSRNSTSDLPNGTLAATLTVDAPAEDIDIVRAAWAPGSVGSHPYDDGTLDPAWTAGNATLVESNDERATYRLTFDATNHSGATSLAYHVATADGNRTAVTYDAFDALADVDPTAAVTVSASGSTVASPDAAATVEPGETVSLDAGESRDNLGIESYEWDLGDGESATGETATVTYDSVGDRTVTVTVADGANRTDTVEATVSVVDQTAPTIESLTPTNGTTFDAETGTVSVNATYADAATGVDPDAVTVAFDGTDVTENATVAADGLTYEATGLADNTSHEVTVTVVDGAGNTVSEGVEFEIAADDDDDDDDDGGGGGGGGQPSDPTAEFRVIALDDQRTVTVRSLPRGTVADAAFETALSGNGLSVDGVELRARFDLTDRFRVEVDRPRATPPQGLGEAEGAVGYVRVEAVGVDPARLDGATVSLDVDPEALPSGAAYDRVRVYGHDGSGWESLTATHEGGGTFTVESPDVRSLAVVVESTTATPTPTEGGPETTAGESTATSPTDDESGTPGGESGTTDGDPGTTGGDGAGFAVPAAVIALLIAAGTLRRRER